MKKNYRNIYREKKSLISSEAHIRQHIHERDIYGSTQNYIFLYAQNGVAEEFHPDSENQRWHRLGKKLLERKFFNKLLTDGKRQRQFLETYLRELRKLDLSNLSDTALAELFERGYKIYSRMRGYFKTSRPEFQSLAEQKLKEILQRKLKDTDRVQKAFETLATPAKLDEVNKEFVGWVGLVSHNAKVDKFLENHLQNYPWLVAQSYDRREILKTMKKKFRDDREDLSKLKNEASKLKLKKRKLFLTQMQLLKRLNNKAITYLSWLFQQAALERMKLKGGWAGADYLYLPLYREISRRTSIALKDLYSYYRIGEVNKAVKKGAPTVTRAELKRRRMAYILWWKNRKLHFSSGPRAEKIIRQELKQTYKKLVASGLKGHTASSGVAKGRVRIIISGNISMLNQAFRDFRKGNIMITTMTQPNMVPLMKKAAAIVTDEGGLVSHAAILAREFKIPCIVGTEIGTRTFRNGDLVEVDANKGVVKKLE